MKTIHQGPGRPVPPSESLRRAVFAVYALAAMCFMAASSAPTPLYRVYQAEWELTPALMTSVFAVYAVSLLAALLTVGSLSDYLGRKSVILSSLALEIVSIVLFLVAADAWMLIAARLVQGLATGAATAALAAGLADLSPKRAPLINSVAPIVGLAAGALGSAALVEYGPNPLHLVYLVLFALLVLLFVAAALLAPAGTASPGALASLRPTLSVPGPARIPLLAVAPALVAVWALGGFFLSLGPTLAADVTGSRSALIGGWTVFALTMSGAVAVLVLRTTAAAAVLRIGSIALVAGVAVALAGTNTGSAWLFFAGTAVAGIGFGAGFQGAMRSVMPLAESHQRAGLLAAFYVVSYLAMGVPSVAAGFAVPFAGIRTTATAYGALVVTLGLAALIGTWAVRPRNRESQVPHPAQPLSASDVPAHSLRTTSAPSVSGR